MNELTPIYRVEFFLDAIVNGGENPYEPMSPVEKYLARIAGADLQIPVPISSMDFYLAKLCGEVVELPTPVSRIDHYLAAICGEDVEVPDPVYRIEFWLNAWASGGSGSIVTVTGVSPLALVNALAKPIRSLTQYGKCVQSGTPTPSAPVPILCNNGELKVGRETYTTSLGRTVYGGTLDLVSGVLTVDRAMITLDGSEAWVKSSNGNVYYLTLNTSTFPYGQSVEQYNVCDKYVFKGFASGGYASFLSNGEYLLYRPSGSSAVREIAFRNNSITSVADWKASLQSNPVQVVYELDTPQTYQLTPQTVEMIAERSTFQSNANGNIDITYYANGILKTVSGNPVVITDADGQNAEDVTVHIEPIQSGSGTPSPTNIRPISGMTDISITRLGGVVVDGTPEVLTVGGANLLDPSAVLDVNKYINGNNGQPTVPAAVGETYRYSGFIPVKAGTKYYFGMTPFTAFSAGLAWYSDTTAVTGYISGTGGTTLQNNNMKATAPAGAKYLRFCWRIDEGYDTDWEHSVYVCECDSNSDPIMTAWQAYVQPQTVNDIPMLLSVGDYADEAEIISGLLTRKCGILILDGTEAWTEMSGGSVYRADLDIDATFSLPSVCLCTHYLGDPSSTGASAMPENSIKCGFQADERYNRRVYLKDTSLATAADVSSFLAAQYAAGTPVIVIYSLATETTEQGTAHSLHTTAGDNVVTVTSEVDPVELEVEYTAASA